jgi:hypothetical protein
MLLLKVCCLLMRLCTVLTVIYECNITAHGS